MVPMYDDSNVLTRYDIWDLNEGKVPEFPVENPPGWDAISLYYARALQKMGWLDPSTPDTDVSKTWEYSEKPDTYYFQAAMHWTQKFPNTIPPDPFRQWWNHCTHGPATAEDYFLAWHRGYIYWFEVIVRSWVAELGGPESWALPYWNYSYHDAGDPNEPWPRAKLPWVFTQATLPDGSGNPLYVPDTVRRGLQPMWPGETETMYLETTTPYYDQAYGQTDYFDFNSTLDGQPHGIVHVDVGTGDLQVSSTGWMLSTITASFDPIFWLHHAEIDRFWVGWLAQGNADPTDDAWLSASGDPDGAWRWNFWRDGDIANKVVVHPGQMLDPANLADPFPHSYRYANLPQVPAPQVPGRARRAAALAVSEEPAPQPHLAAAAAASPSSSGDPIPAAGKNVDLGKEPVSITIDIPAEMQAVLDAREGAPRVMLHLQDVVAEGPPANYEVYLNYPQANRQTAGSAPQFVGVLPGFGADHHHGGGGDGGHGGHEHHGLNFRYDITDLVRYLRQSGEWDPAKATVTFVPAARPRPGRELVITGLKVGRVMISTE
jgi:tyrosinase